MNPDLASLIEQALASASSPAQASLLVGNALLRAGSVIPLTPDLSVLAKVMTGQLPPKMLSSVVSRNFTGILAIVDPVMRSRAPRLNYQGRVITWEMVRSDPAAMLFYMAGGIAAGVPGLQEALLNAHGSFHLDNAGASGRGHHGGEAEVFGVFGADCLVYIGLIIALIPLVILLINILWPLVKPFIDQKISEWSATQVPTTQDTHTTHNIPPPKPDDEEDHSAAIYLIVVAAALALSGEV